MLVDTHCHIQFSAYDNDRKEVIARSREAGVRMIVVGTDIKSSRAACELVNGHDDMHAAIGLHPNHLFVYPHDADEEPSVTIEDFTVSNYRELGKDKKVAAIGECGLDFYRIPDSLNAEEVKKKQEQVFRAHLDLADELGLPVIVHCRDAHDRAADIISEYVRAGRIPRRGVIHCFTGTKEEAQVYLELGFCISFTGIITFAPKKGQGDRLADLVRALPLDRILVETDAPYLAPVPHRGKRNESAYVREVARRIAEIKAVSFDEVVQTTTQTALNLFLLRRHTRG